MARDAKRAERQGVSVHQPEQRLHHHDGVDQPRDELPGYDRVFFDQLRQIVEARCCVSLQPWFMCRDAGRLTDGQHQKGEAEHQAQVAHEGKDPHHDGPSRMPVVDDRAESSAADAQESDSRVTGVSRSDVEVSPLRSPLRVPLGPLGPTCADADPTRLSPCPINLFALLIGVCIDTLHHDAVRSSCL